MKRNVANEDVTITKRCLKNSPKKETLSVESRVANSISASAKSKENVLMTTASAFVYGEDCSKRIRITILFDSESQCSYVSEKLARQLTLDAITKETFK